MTMSKTDAQLKSNDCGISALKTIFNLAGKDISRKYIEHQIPIEQKGSRLSDLKDFLNKHGFIAEYKLLDVNHITKKNEHFQSLLPFILPVKHKSGLHYVVVSKFNRNKFKIHDPSNGREYYLTLAELKKKAHHNKSHWELTQTKDRIIALCSKDLAQYQLDVHKILETTDFSTLFNKLTYLSYLKDNFGFKDFEAEKKFLLDLLKNQEIAHLPKHFKTLKEEKDKLLISAPFVLSVTAKVETESTQQDIPKEESKNLYWQLLKQLGRYKKFWFTYIFAALFSASTAQLAVFINQILIDDILPSYNFNILLLFMLGLGIYKLFDLSTSIYKSYLGIHLANLLDRYFLQTFDQKINAFSLPYIHTYKKGDLVERISDSLKLKSFFLRFFTNVLIDSVVSIYSLGILFYINPNLTFIVIGAMVLFYAWYKVITPRLKQNERLRYMRKADFLSKTIEKVEGIQVIKSFKLELHHSNKVFRSINDYLTIQRTNGYVDLVNRMVVASIIILSSLGILYYLTDDAFTNKLITTGQIITFVSLSNRIFSSLRSILDENLILQENEVILKRFLDFDEPLTASPEDGIKHFDFQHLEIKNLSFGYLPGHNTLEDLNIIITRGTNVKIEGYNGSGKSTLGKILTTLYQPSAGKIIINEIDRKFYDPDSIKEKILLVTNEDILFNDTLRANICLGKEIRTSKILALAKQLDFYDFISSKEEALGFIIHENGKNLSTGQRKKILLLRALFSNAELIILDEVLSGMDIESRNKAERLIQESQSKTFIIISHEPINYIHFSQQYRLEKGKLKKITEPSTV